MKLHWACYCAILIMLAAALPSLGQAAPPPSLSPTGPWPTGPWDQTSISFGLSTYSGTINSTQFTAQLNSTFRRGRTESEALGNVGFLRARGQRLSSQGELDWALRFAPRDPKGRLFSVIHTWFERDENSGIDFRGSVGGGVGTHLINNAKTRLTLEGGVAATTEKQVVDKNYPELFFDPTLRSHLSSSATVQEKLYFRYDLHNQTDVRVYSDSGLNFQITKRVGIGLHLVLDFDNEPVRDRKKLDIQSSTNLLFTIHGNPGN